MNMFCIGKVYSSLLVQADCIGLARGCGPERTPSQAVTDISVQLLVMALVPR